MAFIINPYIFGAAGYVVDHALVFNGVDEYLQLASPSARSSARIGTLDFWFKRHSDGGSQVFFGQDSPDTGYGMYLWIDASKRLQFSTENADGSVMVNRISTGTFLDTTSWYHVNIQWDTGQTDNTSCTVRVNSVAIAMGTTTNPASAIDNPIFKTGNHIRMGRWQNTDATRFLHGSFANVCYHDGVHCINGETSDGIWIPTDPTDNAFGDGGFFLEFGNPSSLGADTSGNSHNFDVTNLVAADQLEDSPTNDADNDVGNYPTINPSLPVPSVAESQPSHVLSEGNLTATGTGSPGYVQSSVVTQGISSGKFYWEFTFVSGAISSRIGIATAASISATAPNISVYVGNEATSNTNWALNAWASGAQKGKIGHGTGSVTQGNYANSTTWAASDVVGVALDMDNGALWFHRNGTYLGADLAAGNAATISEVQAGTVTNAAVGPNSNCGHNVNLSSLGTVIPCFTTDGGGAAVVSINFGQKAFAHTVPTGFKRLMSANMAALSVSSPATGSFTGNALAGGPFIYLGYTPNTSGTSTITESGGSASTITWGTHARAYSNGFKIIASADDYNKAAVNAYSIAIDTDAQFASNNRSVVS
jgi:hypothetical protein